MAKHTIATIMERKLNPLSIDILGDLKFGSLDGERDKTLKNSFVLTRAIQELLKNNYNYVLSPKGAGKSSVFKALVEKYPISKNIIDLSKYHFIPINRAFDTTDDNYLEKEKFKTDLGHKKYTVSWSFYLAIKLIEDILINHKDKSNYFEFENSIKKYDNFKDKYELYNILDYVESFNVALKFTAGGIDYTISPTFGNKRNVKQLRLNEIFKLINDFYTKNNLIARLLIDRVDNFVEKEEFEIQKNYLQGLVYAIEEISLLPNVQPLLFLRTDLFYSHDIIIEYDKIRERLIELKWTKDEILFFIVKRFLSIEQIKKNHFEYFQSCFIENYGKKSSLDKHKNKAIIFIKKILHIKEKYNIAKNINYKLSYQFLKLYFPNKVLHLNENKKEETLDFCDWLFSHFVDGNDFINPRSILRYLNLLSKKQLEVYYEHNLIPDRLLKISIEDDNLTYNLFRDFVMKDVYEELQNEELRNIYKLLYSKTAQSIFLRINQISLDHTKINYGDVNIKSYNCEKEEYDRTLKYLCLLGYLSISESKTYKINPLHKRKIDFK
ncbi:P-loop ATPase, Sll1717 family [Flavobacterium sp. UBA6031]|uniref:P-loop ATPase, Sll1717 family n=1 Tax=Flavobacterium sp. UBA6031 TaxID=1946551 RepID=UPI0025C16218|nr:hypothetical protein [Flavobacterium sp. UBA6031]